MDYKNTLNLPRTNFSMQAKLSELEPKILDYWMKLNLYQLVRRHSKGRPKFILHDGPPYANGDIHIGHALNKILKDFVVKFKLLQGYSVPFIPGWDCHGLPVEHQLFKELGITKYQIARVEFRKQAKNFAQHFVDIQREQFKRLGLIADWPRSYLTMDFAYEAEIIRAFARLVKGKYIYRGLKPINWCTSCETALAEAEVEYEERRSPSLYVKFKLLDAESLLKDLLQITNYKLQIPVYLAIWTTTPWTLVANAAIAVHPEFNYQLVEIAPAGRQKEILILAEQLVETVMRKTGVKDYQKIGEVKGRELENLQASHPFLSRSSRIVLADYVSGEEGTGLVHTAPGHGQEDYLTGLKYKLPLISPVDERGKFDQTCLELSGISVFQADDLIIEKMRENKSLLYAGTTLHAYPHCWRCKQPLITRSTKQWFINVDRHQLRQKALRQIKRVRWIPESGAARITRMIEARPDWCLSRQRFWGVPLPVFYCKNCGRELLDAEIIERVAQMVGECGSDIWFVKNVEELLGKKLRCPFCQAEEFIKEEDIIDVWFDSGISHQAVLTKDRDLGFPATLYLEGSDQHRGWFQTALLTAIPLTGRAPYEQVLTHGFVVDGEGKKMSKSRGNVVSPQEVISEYGAEILRLWVASCDYSDDLRISAQILTGIADAYRKIRNTLRFLLGNLYDFTPAEKIKYSRLCEIDKWALSSLANLVTAVTEDFTHFHYYRVFRRLYDFCTREMSSFYLDILKDRLYTLGEDSLLRRSAQTAMCELLASLTKMLAPLITFTAEETWGHLAPILQVKDMPSVLLLPWPKIERAWINPTLDEKMNRLTKVRTAVLKAIENEREKGIIHSSLEARVVLYSRDAELFQFLKTNGELLLLIFIVSDVSIEKVRTFSSPVMESPEIPHLGIKVEKINFPKCARCWNYRVSVGKDNTYPLLCQRCIEVIKGERAR